MSKKQVENKTKDTTGKRERKTLPRVSSPGNKKGETVKMLMDPVRCREKTGVEKIPNIRKRKISTPKKGQMELLVERASKWAKVSTESEEGEKVSETANVGQEMPAKTSSEPDKPTEPETTPEKEEKGEGEARKLPEQMGSQGPGEGSLRFLSEF